MTDRVSVETRSKIMRSVGSKNTGPELLARSAAHRLGLRFRLHDRNLPGRPDLVFKRWNAVIFVNGCFWHRHTNCAKANVPKTNVTFWQTKFDANVARDAGNYRRLKEAGWRVIVVWQCEVKSLDAAMRVVYRRFALFMNEPPFTKRFRTLDTRSVRS